MLIEQSLGAVTLPTHLEVTPGSEGEPAPTRPPLSYLLLHVDRVGGGGLVPVPGSVGEAGEADEVLVGCTDELGHV